MSASLVGSEMCIRDRPHFVRRPILHGSVSVGGCIAPAWVLEVASCVGPRRFWGARRIEESWKRRRCGARGVGCVVGGCASCWFESGGSFCAALAKVWRNGIQRAGSVSYTHLRAHETSAHL
eukprot:6891050-Alexandrium_andersonii.AAC.1